MGHKIERMLIAAHYDTWNAIEGNAIFEQGLAFKRMHRNVKLYLARLGRHGLDERLGRRSMELVSISSSLDFASDAMASVMLDLAKQLDTQDPAESIDASNIHQETPRSRKQIKRCVFNGWLPNTLEVRRSIEKSLVRHLN